MAAALGFTYLSSQPSTTCSGVVQSCRDLPGGLQPFCVLFFIPVLLLVVRRLVGSPGLRLGERGLEDRTSLLSFLSPTRVLWAEIQTLYPSAQHPLSRTIFLGLKRPGGKRESPTGVRVRISGLSISPGEIEAEIAERLDRSNPTRQGAADAHLIGRNSILEDIELVTDKLEIKSNVTARRLLEVLRGLEPGSYLIVSAPVPRGEERFIQAYHREGSTWYVEYRDGGPGRQYGADCHSMEMVFEMLLGWAEDGSHWPTDLPWERVDLS